MDALLLILCLAGLDPVPQYPRLQDLQRFPDGKTVRDTIAFISDCRDCQLDRIVMYPHRREEAAAAFHAMDQAYDVWDWLVWAQKDDYCCINELKGWAAQRYCLHVLRSLLGYERYYSGLMVDPVPCSLFRPIGG